MSYNNDLPRKISFLPDEFCTKIEKYAEKKLPKTGKISEN